MTTLGAVDCRIVTADRTVVGTTHTPVTCRLGDSHGNDGRVSVDVSVGHSTVSIDPALDHDGCAVDIEFPLYVEVADELHHIGDLACCAQCDPRGHAA